MKESNKEDVKKVANSSLMRFESLNFQPALIAIQNMNSINTQPIIKAMEMQQENTKSIMNSFKLMQEINTTPMLESLERSYSIKLNTMQPTLQAIQQMNQINTTPIIQAMQSYKINTAPIIKVFQQFKEINMTPMIQAIQMIFDSTKMIQNIIDAFSDQMTKLLKNINYKPFYGYFEDVKNLAKNYDISEQLIIKFLNEHQWFVIDSMPEDFILKILEMISSPDKRNKLNEHFFNYFTGNNFKNLTDLVDKWNSSGKLRPGRLKVINDCTNSILKSENNKIPSTMIVPTLIAQIDGLQREFLIKNNFEPVWIKYKYEGEGKTMNQQEAWDYIYSPNDSFSEIVNDVILDVLFANVNPGEPIKTPITFSRHKIMHGEHLNYGTKPNTIRTFLILDFLHELL